jgi:hypothetical protein
MPNLKISRSKWMPMALLSMTLISSNKAFSQSDPKLYIDVYGTDKITPDLIRDKFFSQLQKIYKILTASDLVPAGVEIKTIESLCREIKTKTNKLGDIVYLEGGFDKKPFEKNVYFTFDVVEIKDAARLAGFLPKPTKSFPDPDNLLTLWNGYFDTGLTKILIDKKSKWNGIKCPVNYCLYGFEWPELQRYQSIFTTLVPKDKTELVKILREDKDPRNRADAASLLAHIKDGNELMQILLPSMRDADAEVRGTAMAVMAFTMIQLKHADFPVQKAIDALDYPALADRKHALFLLESISKQPRYSQYLKDHSKEQLMNMLKMHMPDIHDEAYAVLKNMSGLKFGDRNYVAWEHWLNTTKS